MARNGKGQFKKLTNEEFLKKVKEKLDYIKILSEYKGSKNKVDYICLKCGYRHSARASHLLERSRLPYLQPFWKI